jgi:hypothetical protein
MIFAFQTKEGLPIYDIKRFLKFSQSSDRFRRPQNLKNVGIFSGFLTPPSPISAVYGWSQMLMPFMNGLKGNCKQR